MNAPVDVLAVLRADRGEGYADYQERQAAIAAVAELIEENKRLRVKARNWDSLLHARAETNAEPDDCEWKQLARKRLLIPSIKACRAAHGYSLMEAKDCVDSYIARCKGESA
jgi:ribosomal protein L7/L12